MNTAGFLKELDRDTVSLISHLQKKYNGESSYLVRICLFSLTCVPVVVLDKINLYPFPHLGREPRAISLTKIEATKNGNRT